MAKSKEGYFFTNDDFRIDIKYDGVSQKEELIKFTPLKGDSVVISADAILELISKNFRVKKAAVAIAHGEVGLIPMVGVLRQIYVPLDRDYKKGEIFTTKMLHKYPWALARLEEAYGIALQNGEITAMPNDKYEDYLKTFDEKNTEYIKAINADVLPKPSEETKEN